MLSAGLHGTEGAKPGQPQPVLHRAALTRSRHWTGCPFPTRATEWFCEDTVKNAFSLNTSSPSLYLLVWDHFGPMGSWLQEPSDRSVLSAVALPRVGQRCDKAKLCFVFQLIALSCFPKARDFTRICCDESVADSLQEQFSRL